MIGALAREQQKYEAQITALERELDHRAEVVALLADNLASLFRQLVSTRAELDEAVRLGTQYATLGRALPTHGGL